ncbi:MAG: DUF2784 family protein [Bacteroidia bacterium]|nr:DUF2784 family protein [Bacteroidia bacterium]
MWYHFLDWFFVVFHTFLTLFNFLGWIWKKTRLANFITLAATAFSWFILGIFFGMGYCLFTDLHWKVLYKLGSHHLPDSYIQYIIHRLTGISVGYRFAANLTLTAFIISVVMSVYLNFFRRKRGNVIIC